MVPAPRHIHAWSGLMRSFGDDRTCPGIVFTDLKIILESMAVVVKAGI